MINRTVFLLLLSSLALSLLQCCVNIAHCDRGYPFNTSLFNPEERWHDFYADYLHGVLIRKGGNPYTSADLAALRMPREIGVPPAGIPRNMFFARQPYSPLDNFAAAALSLLSPRAALAGYLSAVVLGFLAVLVLHARWFAPRESRGAFLCLAIPVFLTSHPFLYMVDRGNSEGMVGIFCWLFLLLYKRKSVLAWLPLALAVSVKPQVGLLAGLALLREDWAFLRRWGSASAALAILPIVLLPGPTADSLRGFLAANKQVVELFQSRLLFVRFNHTLFNLIRGLFLESHRLMDFDLLARIVALPSAAIAAAVLGLLWRARRRMSLEFQALALGVLLTACVPISSDYTLLILFPPFFLLVGENLDRERVGQEAAFVLGLLVVILAPKEYLVHSPLLWFGTGYIVTTLSLLTLLPALLGHRPNAFPDGSRHRGADAPLGPKVSRV